jgi:CRISPR-associated protein Cmr6
MCAYLLETTRKALTQANRLTCENRSLYFDRFAEPTLEKKERQNWFKVGVDKTVTKEAASREVFSLLPGATFLHARLMSRLMVNMAGGVMENAGLLLDRYGLPTIPGSAIKGCARRMALQALHDWSTAKDQMPTTDDVGTDCRRGFNTPADMLAAIALVFGWVEQDWKGNSDFAWACGEAPEPIWAETSARLSAALGVSPADHTPWKKLPNFGGSVAFLPARPNADPGIELDVLTPHHKDYYDGKIPTATDTEDPVPVFFPAVKAQKEGDYFTFPLLPLRRATPEEVNHARLWLAQGLALFGLGAKTNAGYGWFDSSEEYSAKVDEDLARKQRAETEERRRQADAERKKAEAEEISRRKRELEQTLAGLSPQEQEDKKIELMTPEQFETKIRAFLKERKKGGPTDEERQAIIRALRGPRIGYWNEFKPRATNGELSTIEKAIRALSRTMNLGKMP